MLEEEKLDKKPEEIKTKGVLTKVLIALVAILWIVCIVLLVQNVKLMNEVKDISGKMDGLVAKEGALGSKIDTVSGNDMLLWQAIDTIKEQMAQEEQEEQQEAVEYKHRVYLTFDDGPSSQTDRILDILNRYGVKATFFVIGKEGYSAQESLKRIVNEGHTLGMHSYNHKYSELYESEEAFAEDFNKLRNYLYEVTGQQSMFYRFPGGSSNTVSPVDMKVFCEYLRDQGVVYMDWNADSGDASGKELSVEDMLKNCLDDITQRETTILLMHDASNKEQTVELLPVLIEALQNMDRTAILPITEETKLVQHVKLDPPEEKVEETATSEETQGTEEISGAAGADGTENVTESGETNSDASAKTTESTEGTASEEGSSEEAQGSGEANAESQASE